MSAIVPDSCTGNGSVTRLSNGFQEAGIVATSSKTILSNIEQGKRKTTNSFRSSSGRTDTDTDWDKFFQGTENQEFPKDKEEEEEFRQEWSDESFTQLYVQNQLHDKKRRHSTQSSGDTNQKMTTIFCTDNCDLFQAQLYLFDHILSAMLTCPVTSTRRPSSAAEWNWSKLFSTERWRNKEEESNEGDNISHLNHVAIGRLQLLFGHLIDDKNQKEKSGWEWEWEFYNS